MYSDRFLLYNGVAEVLYMRIDVYKNTKLKI